MTRDERDRIRTLIDQTKRARLQRARLGDTPPKRRTYWAAYYTKNRARKLAAQKARRAAA